MILTIAPPQAGVAAEPAGAVTAAMIRAAKAENAMARSAVMGEISSKPDLVWLTSSRVLKPQGSIRGAKISSFSAAGVRRPQGTCAFDRRWFPKGNRRANDIHLSADQRRPELRDSSR